MTRPTARVLALLELLQSGGLRTVGELADRLGVDDRTVRRYVDHLRDLDLPVESVRGRHGGYRLARSHRLPPLMLTDDEALAVALALRAATGTAGAAAAAKVRRVLPAPLARRLEQVLDATTTTGPPGQGAAPDADVLLPLADAVEHARPVTFTYAGGQGPSERVVHPHALVEHRGRWYLRAADQGRSGQERTFRLERTTRVRTLPGRFERPAAPTGEDFLDTLARAPRRYAVRVRVQADPAHVHRYLPASVAVVGDADEQGWRPVDVQAEDLGWLPPLLLALGRPFTVERPAALHAELAAAAARLVAAGPGGDG
ncbi:helix-turn-helix transcriptional regulator [Kineococcus rhizosphaerae]|uniref:Transcriptional regulator n=1 Tax=Kineococcus rhizosphaerae TaxID=559628 RepID=A0A2T0R7F7_9ACTN|nr:WYL domain-containing protein [Kineococcus rhizosphaerae]PRY17090.1 transcriptional regulator [Kineococcus rhizosphaerae]